MKKALLIISALFFVITGAMNADAQLGQPANIFSSINPDLNQAALEQAVSRTVIDALASGMNIELILRMARENPLAERGIETHALLRLTLATMMQSPFIRHAQLRQALLALGLPETLLTEARAQAFLAGDGVPPGAPVAPAPLVATDIRNNRVPVEAPASPFTF